MVELVTPRWVGCQRGGKQKVMAPTGGCILEVLVSGINLVIVSANDSNSPKTSFKAYLAAVITFVYWLALLRSTNASSLGAGGLFQILRRLTAG